MSRARVLICAGSDSGGGAGIQADIKTVTALRGYAMTAVTALTAQDTERVHSVEPVPPELIREQMAVVLGDLGADCVKTGMLHDAAVIDAVTDTLTELAPTVPLVLDPVMVAQSGDRLLAEAAVERLAERLLPLATVVTPNLPEAEALLGRPVRSVTAMVEAAAALRGLGPAAVLLKGGHLAGRDIVDVLATADGTEKFEAPRLETPCTHGTGCTLASAIATGIAQGLGLREAVVRGRAYLHEALRTAEPIGRGGGPPNHLHTVGDF